MSGYCKGIYAGCCIAGCMSPCTPCERIRLGKSTVEKEMARKDRAEHRAAMPSRKRVIDLTADELEEAAQAAFGEAARRAAALRQARHIAKRLATTPQRRCAYKRCNKLFTPKRSKSLYCGISCAQTACSLKRHGCTT